MIKKDFSTIKAA